MRSETDTHAGLLKADLLRELKARGIRGAYARRLAAEWVDHYRNLAEVMPAQEALARLGKPGELAQAAARIHALRPPLTELTSEQDRQVITELKAAGFSMPGL